MKKKFLILTLFSFLFIMNFASAYYGDGLSGFLYGIDTSSVFLAAVFIISFALIHFSLAKVFKDNRAVAGIISLAIAILITHSVNNSNLMYELDTYKYWFQDLGWGTFIFILALIGIFVWIIKEEMGKKKK